MASESLLWVVLLVFAAELGLVFGEAGLGGGEELLLLGDESHHVIILAGVGLGGGEGVLDVFAEELDAGLHEADAAPGGELDGASAV